MAKISILIALLLQLYMTIQGLSPCHEYYTQTIEPETKKILGQIELSSAPIGVLPNLKVGFNTHPLIHRIEPVARLELAQLEEINTTSQTNRRIRFLYYIHFPLGQAIPRLTKIWFDSQLLCPSPQKPEDFITTVEVVYPSNEKPSSLNGPSQDSSVTENSPSFALFSEGIGDNESLKNTLAHTSVQNNNNNNINNINNNNNYECGIRAYSNRTNPLINNGEETIPGQWPWVVALFIVRINHEFKCAGSVLTNRHVLTAAHCLKLRFSGNDTIHPNVLEVALGRFNLRQFREGGTVNRQVESYRIHPDYAHTINGDSDLAILTLRTPVEFSPFIRPICLWSGSTDLQNVVNRTGWVVGWGEDESGHPYTEEPRMVRVPIVSQETCLRSHQVFVALTSERTFCAGLRDRSGPCNGDSGSGLVLFDTATNRYQLRGVVSRSLSGNVLTCDLQNYIVYVDVSKYISWIQQQISTT